MEIKLYKRTIGLNVGQVQFRGVTFVYSYLVSWIALSTVSFTRAPSWSLLLSALGTTKILSQDAGALTTLRWRNDSWRQWQPASQLEARARSRDVPTATYVTHYGAHSLNPKTRALPHSSPFYQKGMSTIEMTTKEKTHSLVMNLTTISKFVVAPTYYNLDRLTKFSFSPK